MRFATADVHLPMHRLVTVVNMLHKIASEALNIPNGQGLGAEFTLTCA